MTKKYNARRVKKGTAVFWFIYAVMLCLAVAAAVIMLSKLWDFIKGYEDSQIYHVTDRIMTELNSGDLSKIFDGLNAELSPYETREMFENQVKSRLDGEITCSKSAKESRRDRPVYLLKCGGEGFAYMSLKKSGTDEKYGFELYDFESVYGIEPEKNEYVRVSLPDNCSFKINGVSPVGETEEKSDGFKETKYFLDYIADVPEVNTYLIDGLMFPPEITFYDKNGGELQYDYDEENKSYSCSLPITDKELAGSAGEFALDFSHRYSKYIANDASFNEVARDIPPETELYTKLYDYEEFYYTWHTSYDLIDDKILSVTQYTDDCFAARVSYTHIVYYNGKEFVYPADNTVYMVRNGDGWIVPNIVMN